MRGLGLPEVVRSRPPNRLAELGVRHPNVYPRLTALSSFRNRRQPDSALLVSHGRHRPPMRSSCGPGRRALRSQPSDASLRDEKANLVEGAMREEDTERRQPRSVAESGETERDSDRVLLGDPDLDEALRVAGGEDLRLRRVGEVAVDDDEAVVVVADVVGEAVTTGVVPPVNECRWLSRCAMITVGFEFPSASVCTRANASRMAPKSCPSVSGTFHPYPRRIGWRSVCPRACCGRTGKSTPHVSLMPEGIRG